LAQVQQCHVLTCRLLCQLLKDRLMSVEILIDRRNGRLVSAQKPPFLWGRQEDYIKHLVHYGNDNAWENVFLIVSVSNISIDIANEWCSPRIIINDMGEEIGIFNCHKRLISAKWFDSNKRLDTNLSSILLLLEDTA
jgi:hypothetical protein